MNLTKLKHYVKRFLAPVFAVVISLACISCSFSEVDDILDIANDVIDIIEEITPTDMGEDDTVEATAASPPDTEADNPHETSAQTIDENGYYYSRDEVALYIHTYGKLPSNYITKSEASKLGWEGGSVERYAEGCAIGGDKFGNREGILPKKSGRTYTECDIDTLGESSRGGKSIVFSNDGLIYYTDDHYETFVLLYGEE